MTRGISIYLVCTINQREWRMLKYCTQRSCKVQALLSSAISQNCTVCTRCTECWSHITNNITVQCTTAYVQKYDNTLRQNKQWGSKYLQDTNISKVRGYVSHIFYFLFLNLYVFTYSVLAYVNNNRLTLPY